MFTQEPDNPLEELEWGQVAGETSVATTLWRTSEVLTASPNPLGRQDPDSLVMDKGFILGRARATWSPAIFSCVRILQSVFLHFSPECSGAYP